MVSAVYIVRKRGSGIVTLQLPSPSGRVTLIVCSRATVTNSFSMELL